ncbi:MAG: hypothetical protein Fur0046_38470 [Cyanobacteria bacterium J069]
MLVAVSLTAVLVALLPTLRELSRAARSAEKLFDTLNRELPPTLESIRLTGLELTDLTDDVSEGVQSAGRMVKQVDQSLLGVQQQAKKAQRVTRSLAVGLQAAWQTLLKPSPTAAKTARSRRATPPRMAEDYDTNGYEPDGYEPDGYNPDGYEPHGYNPDGYEPDGYNPDGYEAGGYHSDVYTPHGDESDRDEFEGDRNADPLTQARRAYSLQSRSSAASDAPNHRPKPDVDADLRDRPEPRRKSAEPTDAHDPDDYSPRVYGSEQYDEPYLWDYDPAKQDANPAVQSEVAPSSIQRRSPASTETGNWAEAPEDMPTSGDRAASP